MFDLKHMMYRGHFPQPEDGTCISALAFNALGSMLAAATAGGGLMLYQVIDVMSLSEHAPVEVMVHFTQYVGLLFQVVGRRVAPWHMANSSTLTERLAAVPAAIRELSFSPDPKVPTQH